MENKHENEHNTGFYTGFKFVIYTKFLINSKQSLWREKF